MAKTRFVRKYKERKKAREEAEAVKKSLEASSPSSQPAITQPQPTSEATTSPKATSQAPQAQPQAQAQPSPFASPISETLTDFVTAVAACARELEPPSCGDIMNTSSTHDSNHHEDDIEVNYDNGDGDDDARPPSWLENPEKEGEGEGEGELSGSADISGNDSFNSDDLDGMLESMDIDKDFNMWSSFRNSIGKRGSVGRDVTVPVSNGDDKEKTTQSNNDKHSNNNNNNSDDDDDALEAQDIETWRHRLARSEVFSHRYRPDAPEVQELRELETLLGMNTKLPRMPKLAGLFRSASTGETNGGGGGGGGGKRGGGKRKPVSEQDLALWNQLVQPSIDPSSSASGSLPASIILKRGPALMMMTNKPNNGIGSSGDHHQPKEEDANECELILLTHGLIVATVSPTAPQSTRSTGSGSGRSQKLVPRSFERAVLWKRVSTVAPSSSSSSSSSSNDASNSTWEIQLGNGKGGQGQRLVFTCASPRQRQAWLDAMEKVVVEYHSHSSSKTAGSKAITSEFGWQYRYIVKPTFTMAVTDQTEYFDGHDTTTTSNNGNSNNGNSDKDLNQLDHYHGYAALHYAVRANHVAAMRCLLDAGANPDTADQDGRTPMYYAVMDQLPHTTVTLLEEYGGTPSKLATEQQSGELFGKVAATQAGIDEERRETAERIKAEKAAVAMSENMRLLQQRGDQIEELDDKARQLNDGAQNFGDMARQLKEQTKKKKWYQL
jgi:hypothetical protein